MHNRRVPDAGHLPRLQPDDYARVILFFANALGDQILALPTLRSLSVRFGDRMTLLTVGGPHSLLFGDVPRARTVQIPISLEGEFDAEAAATELGPADLIVTPQTWHSGSVSALVDRLAPARSVGLDPRFDIALPITPERHQVDQMFDLCTIFGEDRPVDDYAQPFALPDASLRFAQGVRLSIGSRRLLVIHPETKPDKQWPLASWNRALDLFLGAHPEYVVLAVARKPASLEGLTPKAIRIADLPLASAAAVIAVADLFLGVDSFPLHVADLWRVPGVGLFGPSNCREYGFRFSRRAAHIEGGGRMNTIDAETVAATLAKITRESDGEKRPYPVGGFTAPDVTLRYR